MIKPFYEDEFCMIYCGDCLDVLPQIELPAGPKGVLITDPPYILHERHSDVKTSKHGTRKLKFPWDSDEMIKSTILEAFDILFPKVNAFHIFCNPDIFGNITELAFKNKLSAKPWVKIKKCPPPAMPGNWWPSGFELAIFGHRTRAYFGDTKTDRSNVYYADSYRHGIKKNEKVDHPTQKWLPMITYIVDSIVYPSATVIDPFCGSGTTLVASKSLNRKAIGIEINNEYCEIAAARVSQEVFNFNTDTQESLSLEPK